MAKRSSSWTGKNALELKAKRNKLGMSQAKFAELAGVSRRRYSWIEYADKAGNCPVRPSERESAGIAKALEPKANELKAKVKAAVKRLNDKVSA